VVTIRRDPDRSGGESAGVPEDVLSSVELRWRPGTDQAASSLL
jgi:hypothetical protein